MNAKANNTIDKVRELQRGLYQCAKNNRQRRFHALYDKVHRMDVLWKAWDIVRKNKGAGGVDEMTIGEIEDAGVEAFLLEIKETLEGGDYRPRPVKRTYLQEGRKEEASRTAYRKGQGGPDRGENRHGTHLRGGLQGLLLRVSAQKEPASGAGGHPEEMQQQRLVGAGRGYQRILRQHRPREALEAGGEADMRQEDDETHPAVAEGRCDGGWPRDRDRNGLRTGRFHQPAPLQHLPQRAGLLLGEELQPPRYPGSLCR